METTAFHIGKLVYISNPTTIFINFPVALLEESGFLLKLFEELKFFGPESRSYISRVSIQLSKTGSAANNSKLSTAYTKTLIRYFLHSFCL